MKGIWMSKIYREGQWIDERVKCLSKDSTVLGAYRNILERTLGDAANELSFPFDSYSAKDGIGRPEKADIVGTWLCVERRVHSDFLDDPKTTALLEVGSLDEIWNHAKGRLNDLNFDDLIPPIAADEEVLVEFEDGCKIVGLNTPEAIRNESLRSDLSGATFPQYDNWVLRDQDGTSIALMILEGNKICRLNAPHRQTIPAHVISSYLIDEIVERELELEKPAVIPGWVQTSDGKIYSYLDLPDGSTINGSILIDKCSGEISRLPDNLTVKGHVTIVHAPFFTETPKNLVVEGGFGVGDNVPLKLIKSGFRVHKDTDLSYCKSPNLRIENDVDFGQDVCFSANLSKLDAAPFSADMVSVIDGLIEQAAVPRNNSGQVVINERFLDAAKKAKIVSEIKKLPGALVSIGYHEVKSKVERKIRAWKKNRNKDNDLNNDEDPNLPKM